MKINEIESSDDYFCDEKIKNIPANGFTQRDPLDIMLFLEEIEQDPDDEQSNEFAEALRQL